MADPRIFKGVLSKLGEVLDVPALREEAGTTFVRSGASIAPAGVSLAGRGTTITRAPAGVLAKEPTINQVHPDIWNAAFGQAVQESLPSDYAPLWRGFHGSNSRTPFDTPVGGQRDIGISMTSTPDVSDYHALGRYNWGTDPIPAGAPGARVYPLLADPGNTMEFPRDTQDWSDPANVAYKTQNDPNYDPSTPGMKDVMRALGKGQPLNKTLADMGYQSIAYPHMNPWLLKSGPVGPADIGKVTGRGLTVFDPTRVVPEYSKVGQLAGKTRGILAAGGSVKEGATAADLTKLYGQNASPDEFSEYLFDPESSRVGRLERLNEELGAAKSDDEANATLTKVKDLAATMSPGAIQDGITHVGYVIEGLQGIASSKKPGVDVQGARNGLTRANRMVQVLQQALGS